MIKSLIRGRSLIVLIVAYSIISAGCARKLSPSRTFSNIENKAEEKRLDRFISGGVEKSINNSNLSADAIINTAKQYLGVPHCMGGTTSKCMDCSGLLVTGLRKYGVSLRHNSEEQARYGKIIPGVKDLRKGDLVFFIRSYKTDNFITHSGICIGNNEFIHTSTSRGVTITSLNDLWWREKFIFGTRILK